MLAQRGGASFADRRVRPGRESEAARPAAKPEPAAARAEPTNITDLMAALEASVAAARTDRKAEEGRKGKAAGAEDEAEAEAPRQRRRKTA